MTLKNYLILMAMLTCVCWAIFAGVIFTINPNTTNWPGFAMFYASLFLAVSGTAAIIGFLVRFGIFRQVLIFHSVREAFRQSFLFSILIICALFLSSRHLLTSLNIAFLIAGLAMLEFVMINYGRSRILRQK